MSTDSGRGTAANTWGSAIVGNGSKFKLLACGQVSPTDHHQHAPTRWTHPPIFSHLLFIPRRQCSSLAGGRYPFPPLHTCHTIPLMYSLWMVSGP